MHARKLHFVRTGAHPYLNFCLGLVFGGATFVLKVGERFRNLTVVRRWVGMAQLRT